MPGEWMERTESGIEARRLRRPCVIARGVAAAALAMISGTALALPPIAVDDFASTRSGPTAGLEVSLDASANDSDPEGDPLDYVLLEAPTNGTAIVGPSGTVRYTPNAGFVGADSFLYEVSDGFLTATGTVTIDVVADQAPVAADDSATVGIWPGYVEIRVLDNDSDPDGDLLAYRDIVVVTQPQNGFLEINCLGACAPPTYTPNRGFAGGDDSFTYVAVDPLGGQSNIATVSITVNGPPVAADDVGEVFNGQPVVIDVLANDTDPNGDSLTAAIDTPPAGGTAQVTAGGILYTPNPGFVGQESFTYTASDGTYQSAPATVTIVFSAVTQPPTAVDDQATTSQDSPVLIDVLANDTDPDNVASDLSILSVTQPQHGTTAISGRQVQYTPASGFVGTDTFDYVVTDMVDGADTGTVTVTVTAVNQPPTAVDDQAATAVDTAVLVDVLGNDTDPDNVAAELFIGSLTSPQHGSAVVSGRQVQYTPASGYAGNDTFDYVVRDAAGATDTGTVTVSVVRGNVPPTAVIAGGNRTVPDTDGQAGEAVLVDGSASFDPDGSVVFYEWSVNGDIDPEAISASETFQLADGVSTISLRVYDNNEAVSSLATVTITVSANVPPVAVIAGGNRTVADSDQRPGEAVTFDGSGSSDANGAIAGYQWSVNGQPVPGTPGASPTLNLDDGTSTVSLIVTDDAGAQSAPASVVITVSAANPGPTVTIAGGDRQIPDGDGQPGELVPFEGSATDDGGPVDVATFRWTVNGNPVDAADGQSNPTLALAQGANAVTLTAADAQGATGSAAVTVTIGEPNPISDLPGLTENQKSTAQATESVCSDLLKRDPAGLTEQQRDLRTTCDSIFSASGSGEAVGSALDQISGQQITSQQTTAIDFSSAQLLNVGARLRALRMGARGFNTTGFNLSSPDLGVPTSVLASLGKVLLGEGGGSGDDEGGLLDRRLGIFINGSVRWGNKDPTKRESGFDFDTKGVTLGADYRFTDSFVAGLAVGYADGTADFDSHGGSQDSTGYSGSLYGSWYGTSGYVDTIVSYGQVDYESVRNIDITQLDIHDTALGTTSGAQWAIGLGGGYDFGRSALRFGPTGSVNYIRVDVDGFTEHTTGDSGLAMSFGDQTGESLMIKVGGQIAYQLSRKWGILSPQARLDIVHELLNDAQVVHVRYANATVSPGSNFVIFTDNPDRNFFNWAVGFAATFANGFSGFIDYESMAGYETLDSAELSLGLRYETQFR
jgi:uncharacterized protein YhjY with autotransporter beta-barrel domain